MKRIVITVFNICLTLQAFAQNPAEEEKRPVEEVRKASSDTVELQSYATRYNPKKAALFAAVVPGLGQVYNKKYWKLPLVYGGFIGFGYGLNFYQKGYTKYKGELFEMLETGADRSASNRTEQNQRNLVDTYRRQRDLFLIFMAGMYLLQIVDAHVDAHLKEFDLNPNLHVRLEPVWENDVVLGQTKGLALKFRF